MFQCFQNSYQMAWKMRQKMKYWTATFGQRCFAVVLLLAGCRDHIRASMLVSIYCKLFIQTVLALWNFFLSFRSRSCADLSTCCCLLYAFYFLNILMLLLVRSWSTSIVTQRLCKSMTNRIFPVMVCFVSLASLPADTCWLSAWNSYQWLGGLLRQYLRRARQKVFEPMFICDFLSVANSLPTVG